MPKPGCPISRSAATATFLILAGIAACRRTESRPTSSSTAGTTPQIAPPAAYVDRVVPRDDALRRFRADLHERPDTLRGSYPSRDALVRELVRVLEQNDTLSLERLVITRAEFAYLYYPTTPLSRPPYELAPGLMWFQLQESNRKGALALLRERGGTPLGYVRHECSRSERQDANTIWSECEIVRLLPGHTARRERLFGSIVERDGHFKFIALSNGL